MTHNYQFIKTTIQDKVGTITLNREEKRNALSLKMIDEIYLAVRAWNEEDTIEVIVIRSNLKNPDIFSSGIDLKDLGKNIMETKDEEIPDLIGTLQDQFSGIATSRMPIIAMINGLCIGAAFELVLCCDFRISTSQSQLGLYETKYGIIPDLGGTTRLIRLTNQQIAKRAIMLAETYSAVEAYRLGMVDWVEDDPETRLQQVIKQLMTNSTAAVQQAKKIIATSVDMNTATSLKQDIQAQIELLASGEPMRLIQEFITKKL